MLQQTAKLGDPSSKETNPLQEARVCESKPHVTRWVPKQDPWVPCAAVCPPNPNIIAVGSPSNVLSTQMKPRRTYIKLHKIGKDETRYMNLGHTKNRSACQFCFPVSAPIRFRPMWPIKIKCRRIKTESWILRVDHGENHECSMSPSTYVYI